MVMAVSGLSQGMMLEDVVYHYRKHDEQMMRQDRFRRFEADVRVIAYERGLLSTMAFA